MPTRSIHADPLGRGRVVLGVEDDRAAALLGEAHEPGQQRAAAGPAVLGQGAQQVAGDPVSEPLHTVDLQPVQPWPQRVLARRQRPDLPMGVDIDDGHAMASIAVTGRTVGHSMSGSGLVNVSYLRLGRRAVAVGGVHRVGVVLGDDLVAEHLEQLEDLVVVQVLRQAEDELVAADRLVGLELLGHLFGVADQHVAAGDQLVEELVGVAAAARSRSTIGDARPRDRVGRLRHRVVVQVHHRHEVAGDPLERDLAGLRRGPRSRSRRWSS